MEIYQVISTGKYGSYVEGAFTTREDAEKRIEELKKMFEDKFYTIKVI